MGNVKKEVKVKVFIVHVPLILSLAGQVVVTAEAIREFLKDPEIVDFMKPKFRKEEDLRLTGSAIQAGSRILEYTLTMDPDHP